MSDKNSWGPIVSICAEPTAQRHPRAVPSIHSKESAMVISNFTNVDPFAQIRTNRSFLSGPPRGDEDEDDPDVWIQRAGNHLAAATGRDDEMPKHKRYSAAADCLLKASRLAETKLRAQLHSGVLRFV
jgi:hypothetical protein